MSQQEVIASNLITQRELQTKYLANSRIILNSPGQQRTALYYTKFNSEVHVIEAQFTNGRYKQGLTTKNFSSTGNCNIPNQSFCGTTVLELILPDIVANQTLPRGWGFNCIESIDYVYGGSNTGNFALRTHSIFQSVMSQCLTAEKRAQIFRLAGEEKLVSDGKVCKAYIPLPLPFSSMQGQRDAKKEYDTSILQSPIQINVHFAQSSNVYGGTGVQPTAFNAAQIILRQGELSNPSLGLKSLVKTMQMSYIYPFIHRQPAVFSKQSAGFKLQLTIDQLINADLLSIYIGIVKASDEAIGPVSQNTPNKFNYIEAEDVVLTHNGLTLMNCPGRSHLVFQSRMINGATYIENSIVNPGTVGPFTSTPINTNFIQVILTMDSMENFEGTFQNSRRYSNQTLNFECTTPEEAVNYNIYVTYLYNGMILTKPAGDSEIYFS